MLSGPQGEERQFLVAGNCRYPSAGTLSPQKPRNSSSCSHLQLRTWETALLKVVRKSLQNRNKARRLLTEFAWKKKIIYIYTSSCKNRRLELAVLNPCHDRDLCDSSTIQNEVSPIAWPSRHRSTDPTSIPGTSWDTTKQAANIFYPASGTRGAAGSQRSMWVQPPSIFQRILPWWDFWLK